MKFALVLGDSHIGDRGEIFSNEIKTFITDYSKKIINFDKVFCTGDLVHADDYVALLSEWDKNHDPFIVQGNMDLYQGVYNPVELIHRFDDFPEITVGLIHGHQIKPRGDLNKIYDYSQQMDSVNILISGHTHDDFVVLKGKELLLNPGSCTGAWSFLASGVPTFIILEFERNKKNEILINVLRFKLKNDELNRDKYQYLFSNGKFIPRLH